MQALTKTILCMTSLVLVLFLTGCNSDGAGLEPVSEVAGDISQQDEDGDGIPNGEDNCPLVANEDQADLDGDGIGDACDSDRDGDGKDDSVDDCPSVPNPGDASCPASADNDGDGIPNSSDNCPDTANPNQEDSNSDGIGDACSSDSDGDGVDDSIDNCPATSNPDQKDDDGDGVGKACDSVENPGDDAYACGTSSSAPFKPFRKATGSVVSSDVTGICLFCSVDNREAFIDENFLNAATLTTAIGVGAEAQIVATDTNTTYPGSNLVGVALAENDAALLNLDLLGGLTVTTFNDGAEQESFTDFELADLDLLGVLNSEDAGFLLVETTQPFDAVQVSYGALVSALNSVDVHGVCASESAL